MRKPKWNATPGMRHAPRLGDPMPSMPVPQTKLEIGAPTDRFEQEAERVADRVMRMPDPSIGTRSASRAVQRLCAECEEEAQRQPVEDEEEVRMKRASGATPEIAPGLQTRISGLCSGGQPLSPALRGFFEPRFGHDFSQVRLHTGEWAAQSARALNALAYTIGRHVVFGVGQYAPATTAGRRLLTHELTHVVQQRSGNQAATIQRAPTYKTCAAAKTQLIDDAIAKAKPLAGSSKQIFEDALPTSSQRQAIRETFGEDVDKTIVAAVYGKIEETLDGKTYECKTSCPKTKDERESCADGEIPGSLIQVCPRFELPTCGAPALTLIHEAAHNEGVHHGEGGAADNAYNYEKFAAKLQP